MDESKPAKFIPKPSWLRVTSNFGDTNQAVMNLMKSLKLHTVCVEAACPNCGECFGRKTATFMILGRDCTRNCTFCCVKKGEPVCPDPQEPAHVAQAVAQLGLRYVVVTSVTRDDIPDGGAAHFAEVIRAIREIRPETAIEVLIPDFQGEMEALRTVIQAEPNVISHNIETVARLYGSVRPQAQYQRSLELLQRIKSIDPSMKSKSGIMVGLGETADEVRKVFQDLRDQSCDFLTIGQYLAPSRGHHPVVEYITPDQFENYREQALAVGFSFVAAGPLVRSSYQADRAWDARECKTRGLPLSQTPQTSL